MKKEKKISDEDYRGILANLFPDLMRGLDKPTSAALSDRQALIFIRSLRDFYKDPYASSDEIRWKFDKMWDEYHHNHCKCDDKTGHKRRFLFKKFKVSDTAFLDRRKAYEAVEALKAMGKRRGRYEQKAESLSEKMFSARAED